MRFRWLLPLLCLALSACQGAWRPAGSRPQVPLVDVVGSVAPVTTQSLPPVAAASEPRAAGRGPREAIFPGGPAIATSEPVVRITPGGRVDLDLVNVEVATAARAVLGDLLKVNYTIDPRVQGRVTLKTPSPIGVRDSVALFEEALAQVELSLTERNGAYVIAPVAPGRTPAGALAVRQEGEGGGALGYGTRAVPLKHVPAKEMADIIQQLSPEAVVRIDSERNLLVLRGSGAQFNALMDTVRTFDVDWLANKSVGLFRIDNMPPETMAKSLGELMANDNMNATMARVTTLEANNSIMIVAKTPHVLATLRRWVARLDRPLPSALRLYAHQMRHARATQVAPLIAGALGLQIVAGSRDATARRTGQSQAAGALGVGLAGGVGANGFGAGGFGGPEGPDLAGIGPAGGSYANGSLSSLSPVGAPSGRRPAGGGVSDPDPARALLGQTGTAKPGGETGPRLVVDEVGNKLLVYATDEQNSRVQQFLRKLDVPEKQVLVEATIIEVALSDDLRFGAQYFIDKVLNGTKIVANLNPNTSGVIGPGTPGGSITVGVSAQALIDTLSQVTRVQVVSSPNLMVLNNQPARLVVGDQVPITRQTRTDPLNISNITVNSVDFRDTGIIFDVTPRVNAGGTVTLDILQEVSSVKRGSAALIPTIAQRRLTSVITAASGETIVLGGLFSTDQQSGSSGIPGVSRVPVLGALFGTQTAGNARTELLVLINARIVEGRDDARAVTREMRERIDGLRLIETGPCRRERGCINSRG